MWAHSLSIFIRTLYMTWIQSASDACNATWPPTCFPLINPRRSLWQSRNLYIRYAYARILCRINSKSPRRACCRYVFIIINATPLMNFALVTCFGTSFHLRWFAEREQYFYPAKWLAYSCQHKRTHFCLLYTCRCVDVATHFVSTVWLMKSILTFSNKCHK